MAKNTIEGLQPEILWQRFYEISQVPRPSKKEGQILTFLRKFADELNISYKEDHVGNIVYNVPATQGYESSPTIVLQSHVDMVCEKNKGTEHDFENDPIKLIRAGDWITADGTTLGSDNGIGVAASLAVVTDKNIVHGPLECLFTVDEETGLTGANNLQPGFITGKTLLNMDSEEDGAFYIGCSGGQDTQGSFNIETIDVPDGFSAYNLMVSGLKGGHSGLDIDKGRGNAIKIIARVLNEIKRFTYYISHIEGGSKRNAIPREAEAIILVKQEDEEKVKKLLTNFEYSVQNEFKSVEPQLKISLNKNENQPEKAYTRELQETITKTLLGVPHGVIAMSTDIEGLVETSTNLATINITNGKIVVGTSQRSSIESAKKYVAGSVESVFSLAKANISSGDGYPGWKPDPTSNIVKTFKEVFVKLFGNEPELKAVHAGLECGILGEKYPGLEMISFGPTIEGAHSPDEKINIATVEKFYKLLSGILHEYANRK